MRGLALAGSVLLAIGAAWGEERQDAVMSKALGFAVRTALAAAQTAAAAGNASIRILDGLQKQREAGKKLDPDQDTIQTALKLRMRVSNEFLKAGAGYRRYPGDEDFKRAA